MILDEKSKRNSIGGNYPYLNKSDSNLYEQVKDSENKKDKIIKKLLEDKAQASRNAHCASRY